MSIIIEVSVVPNSVKSGACLDASNKLKIYLRSVPEGGKANHELIKFFAQALGTTQQAISVVSGVTARRKRVKIELPLTYDDIINRLGLSAATQKTSLKRL
jgi:uncharacterized protein